MSDGMLFMNVSVIINTYNRPLSLAQCLASLEVQTYSYIEVVVVDGPAGNSARNLCQSYGRPIKYIECPDTNLALSRNIGVRESAGDICAFIDDDATAHPKWLEAIVAGYSDKSVVAVGGYTFDASGTTYQSKAILCDYFGDAHSLLDHRVVVALTQDSKAKHGLFPSLLGTNSSFRRQAILSIGGFDENFAYLLEETDLCARLWEHGGHIRTVPDAIVYHDHAISHIRSANNIQKSRYYPTRSKTYFCLKYAHKQVVVRDIEGYISQYLQRIKTYNHSYRALISATASEVSRLDAETDQGERDGRRAFTTYSNTGMPSLLSAARKASHSHFLSYSPTASTLSVACIVRQAWGTRQFPSFVAAIIDLLVAEGCEVHLISEQTSGHCNVTKRTDGLWMHLVRLESTPQEIRHSMRIDHPGGGHDLWSAAAFSQVSRLSSFGIKVIAACLSELQGLAVALFARTPLVTLIDDTFQSEISQAAGAVPSKAVQFVLSQSAFALAENQQILDRAQKKESLPFPCRYFIPEFAANPTRRYRNTSPHAVSSHTLARRFHIVAQSTNICDNA